MVNPHEKRRGREARKGGEGEGEDVEGDGGGGEREGGEGEEREGGTHIDHSGQTEPCEVIEGEEVLASRFF